MVRPGPRTTQPVRETSHPSARDVDLDGLAKALRATIRGEVGFDAGSRAAYATDASNFRQVPLGVVTPRDADDVVAVHALAREFGAPITLRGGGTSLAGQATNAAVIIDTSRHLNRLVSLDPQARTAWVEPGLVNAHLRSAAEQHGLTFGPDPATYDRCTVGGNIGNDSCGAHSVAWGTTSSNVERLEVLLYDGTRLTVGPTDDLAALGGAHGRVGAIYRGLAGLVDRYGAAISSGFPQIPRRVSGYNLPALLTGHVAAALVGSEGTCATVLKAEVRLRPSPPFRHLVVLGFPDVFAAADIVPELLSLGLLALEGIDGTLVGDLRSSGVPESELGLLPAGESFLLAELPGDTAAEAEHRAQVVASAAGVPYAMFAEPAQQRRVWRLREIALAASSHAPGQPAKWEGWEDSAVAPDKLGGYLRDLRALQEQYGYGGSPFYGHFGDGCVHTRIPFDFATDAGVLAYQRFLDDAGDLVVSYGGSLSGEHGDGQQRAHLLEKMYGPELLTAFREFKALWDPDGRMNPGKLVDPVLVYGPSDNLRVGPSYQPLPVLTTFAFADDHGDFSEAVGRCVGVGKCRVTQSPFGEKQGNQVMCPSFQVLGEEQHSTRGRARLLFEMLDGGVVTDGWRSTEVHDALDMCLSCKGCKSDCPVGVDMATYKAEFLSHHYKGRLRPVAAYSMGLIGKTARLGRRFPRLANAFVRLPLAKRLAGVAPQRTAPPFAVEGFRAWFDQRPRVNAGQPRVVLLADTFTESFHVESGIATCEVLEQAGYEVVLPSRSVCCGRPLFDYGFLDEAKRTFLRTLRTLAPEIAAGTPVVVPDPSCCAAFRDELVGLLPDDVQARRLSRQTFTLAEFLDQYGEDWQPPQLDATVLLQTHCHEHAVLDAGAQLRVLARTGATVESSGAGCCGLAGSWGFERDKYDTSMAIGEQRLFPAVRARAAGTVVLADGFSCRTQIADGTGVQALHLAQLLRRG
ncbi:FAD-binding and (Fe-S)-binding domain-containing protein [Acidothermaceae bacterium B102]|nr:FAD-binding and (Fe-S)-binding domain-containing protein [Acidothermaceae bacterium B102]